MSDSNLKPGKNAIGKNQVNRNVDTITEQILTELNGVASRSTIQEVLSEVLPRYENARIQTFVPIFVRRDVVEQLRAVQSPISSLLVDVSSTSPEWRSKMDPASRGIVSDEEDETNAITLIHWNPAT